MSARRVNCAECPFCEVALFAPLALCYIASASRRTLLSEWRASLWPTKPRLLSRMLEPSCSCFIMSAYRLRPGFSGSGGIVHAQRSASLGSPRPAGVIWSCRAKSFGCLSVRPPRVSSTLLRQFADVHFRANAHAGTDDVCAAAEPKAHSSHGSSCRERAARRRAGSATNVDSRSSAGGAEPGSAAALDHALAGATRRGPSARR